MYDDINGQQQQVLIGDENSDTDTRLAQFSSLIRLVRYSTIIRWQDEFSLSGGAVYDNKTGAVELDFWPMDPHESLITEFDQISSLPRQKPRLISYSKGAVVE